MKSHNRFIIVFNRYDFIISVLLVLGFDVNRFLFALLHVSPTSHRLYVSVASASNPRMRTGIKKVSSRHLCKQLAAEIISVNEESCNLFKNLRALLLDCVA